MTTLAVCAVVALALVLDHLRKVRHLDELTSELRAVHRRLDSPTNQQPRGTDDQDS